MTTNQPTSDVRWCDSEKTPVDTTIDTCDLGHRFAKLPDHPMRDRRARCVHCLAQFFDNHQKASS